MEWIKESPTLWEYLCDFLPISSLVCLIPLLSDVQKVQLSKQLEGGECQWLYDSRFYELPYISYYTTKVPFHPSIYKVDLFLNMAAKLGKIDLIDWFFQQFVWKENTIQDHWFQMMQQSLYCLDDPISQIEFYCKPLLKYGLIYGHLSLLDWIVDHSLFDRYWKLDPNHVNHQMVHWIRQCNVRDTIQPWLKMIEKQYGFLF